MATEPDARLRAAAGRRFGLTVGTAFVALAIIAWWRQGHLAMAAFGLLGGSLLLGAIAFPIRLLPVERVWMRLAHLISRVTTPVVMTVLYLLLLWPVGALRRIFGGNPLVHEPRDSSYWHRRPEGQRASRLTRQF